MEESIKLYSQRAISITTFFGGPLAAGILIRENYKSLDKNKQGNIALVIGIVTSILLFGGLFLMPEEVNEKIPNSIIPLIYTAIIYMIVEKIQGKELRAHIENEGEFYSAWKASGVGALSLVIIVGFVFIASDLFYSESDYDAVSYEDGLSVFFEKEATSLEVFNALEYESTDNLIYELGNSLVLWEENKIIIGELNSIENLPEELVTQNELLSKYCDLRITQIELVIKSLIGDTEIYTTEMEDLVSQIDDLIDELN